MNANIFSKIRLRPTQLRTVADRRFDDAEALRKTGQNARANGAMYLGGFVLECLLKARLLERFPWLQSAGSAEGRSKADQHLWSLCYRSHDLDEILDKIPEVIDKLTRMEGRQSSHLVRSLKSICGQWTIFARYSPYTADIDDARTFLDQIKELKSWLD
jgi:hypothetical protein